MADNLVAHERAAACVAEPQHARALPGVDLAFYQVGPQLLYVGVVALTGMPAYLRLLPRWSVGLVLVSSLLPVATLDLLPVAAAGYLVALLPLRRRLDGR
ncbi:hypothetical protein AB0B45_23995 [Nonomuraea sp. NPDC049152]|uniref:hypothetical protein n=1 Tax=Nonomuraea sp. NPDC049152 TaxID=3154350 RepID=UPI0033C51994